MDIDCHSISNIVNYISIVAFINFYMSNNLKNYVLQISSFFFLNNLNY